MARFVVEPLRRKDVAIVKCCRCKTMYVPDHQDIWYAGRNYYEECPTCGNSFNDEGNEIPLWKYNLIKFFRECFK